MLSFQELIYKEFFSQGDLVCGVGSWPGDGRGWVSLTSVPNGRRGAGLMT